MAPCGHKKLYLDGSSNAQVAGFQRAKDHTLVSATITHRKDAERVPRALEKSEFPGPLVLPGDELSFDPDYEPQSAKSWLSEPARNKVTSKRRTIYVLPPPSVGSKTDFVNDWSGPSQAAVSQTDVPRPRFEHIRDYLAAFYHPLPVQVLERPRLSFAHWSGKSRVDSAPSHIGLGTGSQLFGIRHRPSLDGIFSGQLNLNDLLDVAIDVLPKDAYALIMLVDHDLYEDDEDDFCCGRAYGGSRVCVVSSARYNPLLDKRQKVEVTHAWPASHCQSYVDRLCDGGRKRKLAAKSAKTEDDSDEQEGAMHAAVATFNDISPWTTSEQLATLWLGRLCKTASHELGHCFGIDHCVYYACVMQGTAGLSEDARQPPYLCPVDLAKILCATGCTEIDHCRKLLQFCERLSSDRLFASYAAWLRHRLRELESIGRGSGSRELGNGLDDAIVID